MINVNNLLKKNGKNQKLSGFSEACYNQNSLSELGEFIRDLGSKNYKKEVGNLDSKTWGITKKEALECAEKALAEKIWDIVGDGEIISQTDYAKQLNVSRQRVEQMIDEGKIKKIEIFGIKYCLI